MRDKNKTNLTPEEARIVIEKNAVNLAEKVLAGGETLKTAELAVVQQIAAAADVVNAIAFVKNQTELAALLGVERKTIQRWRKEPGAPKPESDGRLNVAAWREWMRANGRGGKEVSGGSRREQLKDEQLALAVEILRVKLAEQRGEVISVATVEAMLSELGATIVAILRQKLENEWPVRCAGLEIAQLRVFGKQTVDDICARLQKAVEPWKKKE